MPGPLNRRDDQHPFGTPWLDSCYQQTLLPSSPWHDVNEKICTKLAEKIEHQLNHPLRKEMIFELVGNEFVTKYFPGTERQLQLLDKIPQDEKTWLQVNAQNWLQNALSQVAVDTECTRPGAATGGTLAPEMARFVEHTRGIFQTGMRNMLQKELLMESTEERNDTGQTLARPSTTASLNGVRGILKNPRATPARKASPRKELTKPLLGSDSLIQVSLSDDAPAPWSMESDVLGKAIIPLLQRDPRRYQQVAAKLHGRHLPASLRNYVWKDGLLRGERNKLKDMPVEKILRERFGKAVSRGIGELNIKRATHCPISSLIDNAIIEIYDLTPSMQSFVDDNTHMKEAARALNILYVYDRTYQPYLVHWLFPIQLAFNESSGDSEQAYELAFHLDLLIKSCFPTWENVIAITEHVLQRLETADPEFHQHLIQTALVKPQIKTKDLVAIDTNKTKAKKKKVPTATLR